MCVKNEMNKYEAFKTMPRFRSFHFLQTPTSPTSRTNRGCIDFGAHQEFGGRCLKFCFRPKVVYVGFSLDKIYTSPRSCRHTKAVLKKGLNKKTQASFLMRVQLYTSSP